MVGSTASPVTLHFPRRTANSPQSRQSMPAGATTLVFSPDALDRKFGAFSSIVAAEATTSLWPTPTLLRSALSARMRVVVGFLNCMVFLTFKHWKKKREKTRKNEKKREKTEEISQKNDRWAQKTIENKENCQMSRRMSMHMTMGTSIARRMSMET